MTKSLMILMIMKITFLMMMMGGEWKVRRSAIRAISSVVESFKHDLFKLWSEEYIWKKNRRKTTVAGALVDRFKEREES